MNLLTWMDFHGISIDEGGVFATAGTDGFNPGKHNLLSVSTAVGRTDEPETVYVRGGNPAPVVNYTGLEPAVYTELAVGRDRAEELLRDRVGRVEFVLCYAAKFTQGFLVHNFPDIFGQAVFLDIIDVFKAYNNGALLTADIGDGELAGLVDWLGAMSSGVRGRYGVDALLAVYGLSGCAKELVDAGIARNTLETKCHVLRRLFDIAALLDM